MRNNTSKLKKLNPRHVKFCIEYIKDSDGGAAARRAGFAESSARVVGCNLLKDPLIKAELAKRQERVANLLEISAASVLRELALMGFANMLDYITPREDGSATVNLSKLNRDQAAAVQEVTVDTYMDGHGDEAREVKRIRFKLADKRGSLELLGKHLKLFTDKHEIQLPPLEDLTNEQLSQLANRLSISVVGIAAGGTA